MDFYKADAPAMNSKKKPETKWADIVKTMGRKSITISFHSLSPTEYTVFLSVNACVFKKERMRKDPANNHPRLL